MAKKTIKEDVVLRPAGLVASDFLSLDEECFNLLMWCGVPAAKAYRLTFNPRASQSSCSALASRKRNEPHMIQHRELLRQYEHKFTFKY